MYNISSEWQSAERRRGGAIAMWHRCGTATPNRTRTIVDIDSAESGGKKAKRVIWFQMGSDRKGIAMEWGEMYLIWRIYTSYVDNAHVQFGLWLQTLNRTRIDIQAPERPWNFPSSPFSGKIIKISNICHLKWKKWLGLGARVLRCHLIKWHSRQSVRSDGCKAVELDAVLVISIIHD
jgi:hypothetical protein